MRERRRNLWRRKDLRFSTFPGVFFGHRRAEVKPHWRYQQRGFFAPAARRTCEKACFSLPESFWGESAD